MEKPEVISYKSNIDLDKFDMLMNDLNCIDDSINVNYEKIKRGHLNFSINAPNDGDYFYTKTAHIQTIKCKYQISSINNTVYVIFTPLTILKSTTKNSIIKYFNLLCNYDEYKQEVFEECRNLRTTKIMTNNIINLLNLYVCVVLKNI